MNKNLSQNLTIFLLLLTGFVYQAKAQNQLFDVVKYDAQIEPD